MLIALKIIAVIICVIALVVTFRTENVLKSVFRVTNMTEELIFKTKMITLIIVAIVFCAIMILK